MTAKAKIAISLDAEVLNLVDRHAAGRSRSRCIEQELLRALRAREWERLSAQLSPEDAAQELAWAEGSWTEADATLAREEPKKRAPVVRPRRRT